MCQMYLEAFPNMPLYVLSYQLGNFWYVGGHELSLSTGNAGARVACGMRIQTMKFLYCSSIRPCPIKVICRSPYFWTVWHHFLSFFLFIFRHYWVARLKFVAESNPSALMFPGRVLNSFYWIKARHWIVLFCLWW